MSKKPKLTAYVYNKKGALISIGTNSYEKTHPLQAYFACKSGNPDKVFLHAEIAALVKCRAKPYKIYVERLNKNGEPRLAKPCEVCKLAIDVAGIEVVEYTLSNDIEEGR